MEQRKQQVEHCQGEDSELLQSNLILSKILRLWFMGKVLNGSGRLKISLRSLPCK